MSTMNIFDLTDTWNEGSTVFNAIKMNVTDTASAAGSLLIDLQVGSVSQFRVTKAGAVTAVGNISGAAGLFSANISAGTSSNFNWTGRARVWSTADGIVEFTNNANNDFTRLQLGGTTNAFGAIGRDGAGVKFVGADGTSVSWTKVPGVTVANLPAAATAGAGARSFVTDALAPVFGSAVAGSGAVNVPVYSDGSTWNVG
jgi:hypothetical protein